MLAKLAKRDGEQR